MLLLFFIITTAFLVTLLYIIVYLNTRQYILEQQTTGHFQFCLVLGAGLEKNGLPSDILMDRVCTAVKLIENRKVDYLIMSGSRRRGYDEPEAMKAAALAAGIPESKVRIDPKGVSTLDSCENINEEYKPDSILIVTQLFHLPRSIYLARRLGIKAFGFPANIYRFSWHKRAFWHVREFFALPYNFVKLAIYSHKTET